MVIYSLIEIDLNRSNSWGGGREKVFKGRCNDLEFFNQILDAVL